MSNLYLQYYNILYNFLCNITERRGRGTRHDIILSFSGLLQPGSRMISHRWHLSLVLNSVTPMEFRMLGDRSFHSRCVLKKKLFFITAVGLSDTHLRDALSYLFPLIEARLETPDSSDWWYCAGGRMFVLSLLLSTLVMGCR